MRWQAIAWVPRCGCEELNRPVQLWTESRFTLLRLYEGRGLIGEKYLLTNISDEPMVLAEQEFDRAEGDVLGVSIESHNLRARREHQRVCPSPAELIMADQDSRFLDKLTPRQRQFLTLGGIAFLLFGVLWAVLSVTDTPKQPGASASVAPGQRSGSCGSCRGFPGPAGRGGNPRRT